jgi:hypothetical protein
MASTDKRSTGACAVTWVAGRRGILTERTDALVSAASQLATTSERRNPHPVR